MFAFLLAQLRSATGDRDGAIVAARVATQHRTFGLHALRWLAARADEQGLSGVVAGLLAGRTDPAARVLLARAARRSGDVEAAARHLDALTWAEDAARTGGGGAPSQTVSVPRNSALARRAVLERMRVQHAAGHASEAAATAASLIAAKSIQAEEAVDFLLGPSDPAWQQRLTRQPADAAAVLDALIYTAQRRRYERATPALELLAEFPGIAQGVRCHARSWAARTHDRRGAFAKSLVHYSELAKGCASSPDTARLRVDEGGLGSGELAWRTGRALALSGQPDAAAHVQRALDIGLKGLDADDARTLLMALAVAADAPRWVAQYGPSTAQDYAERDIVDVVVWRLAQERIVAGRWSDALPLLDRLAAVRDRDAPPGSGDAWPPGLRFDDRDWARGRADYFAGRALQALGKPEAAQARWARVIERHPLTWFAELARAQFAAMGAVPPAPRPDLDAFAGPRDLETTLRGPAVQRARRLGQLGWHDEATDELDLAGLAGDPAVERWAAGDPGGVWTRAALDDEAGRWTASHSVGRDAARRFARNVPSAANRLAWELAYPRAFRTLMDAAAQEAGLRPAVLYAIGRSESGFNPRVESHAHAIGLLQLILPTAQAMAKTLGLQADAQTLRQPAVNVRLGARYLRSLHDRFERDAQMAAGYNAGGGAVGRWRKQRGEWPMDLFVEAIPFRETRDYAKRVVASIAVYRTLYDAAPPDVAALTQKPVPVGDEPVTEPTRGAETTRSAPAAPAAPQAPPLRAQPAPLRAQPAPTDTHKAPRDARTAPHSAPRQAHATHRTAAGGRVKSVGTAPTKKRTHHVKLNKPGHANRHAKMTHGKAQRLGSKATAPQRHAAPKVAVVVAKRPRTSRP
ncbi:MAG: lytic transglycosylase domain-containing protein [Myxococcales bacterium]|nr:lytic transglycosylase domain-containing protein [Myxococcales bacterium]